VADKLQPLFQPFPPHRVFFSIQEIAADAGFAVNGHFRAEYHAHTLVIRAAAAKGGNRDVGHGETVKNSAGHFVPAHDFRIAADFNQTQIGIFSGEIDPILRKQRRMGAHRYSETDNPFDFLFSGGIMQLDAENKTVLFTSFPAFQQIPVSGIA